MIAKIDNIVVGSCEHRTNEEKKTEYYFLVIGSPVMFTKLELFVFMDKAMQMGLPALKAGDRVNVEVKIGKEGKFVNTEILSIKKVS